MKRYAGKSSRATKNASAKKGRDPAWYGSSEGHSRAAKKGVRKKKVAKAAASVKSKQGWLTRYQEESAKLRAKKRPSKKDVERLKVLRAKIRDQKASLLRKRPVAKKAAAPKKPPKKPLKKLPRVPRGKPKKPTARQQAAAAKVREEAKRERAKVRRRALAEERRAAAERERRAKLRRQRARKKAIEAQKEQQRIERERLAREAERRAEKLELVSLRKFQRTEMQRRRQATLDAADMLAELRKVYGIRVPSEGEMMGIAQATDLTLREIYSIFYGSPEVFAA